MASPDTNPQIQKNPAPFPVRKLRPQIVWLQIPTLNTKIHHWSQLVLKLSIYTHRYASACNYAMHVCVHMHTHPCLYTHSHARTHRHIYKDVHRQAQRHIIDIHIDTWTHRHVSICMYAHSCRHKEIHVCTCRLKDMHTDYMQAQRHTDTGTHEHRHVCTCRLKDTCIYTGTDTVTDAYPLFLFPTKPRLVALGTLTLKNWSSTKNITSRFPQTPGGGPHELSFPSLDFSLEISQISLMGAQPPNSWSPWSSVRSEVLLWDFSVYILITWFCRRQFRAKWNLRVWILS